jgi:DNA repair ATPase RecN
MEDRGTPFNEGDHDGNAVGSSTLRGPSQAFPNNDAPKESQPTAQSNDEKLGSPGAQKPTYTLEDANNELARLMHDRKVSPTDISNTNAILKEYASLKEKVDKLKSLLGRSAKAQRETKVDLDAAQKRLSQALREIERLNQKLDKLQSRPTHCKLFRLLEPWY